MSDYLPVARIHELTEAAIGGNLVGDESRDDLLSGISIGFASSLPIKPNPLDQFASDLNRLNSVNYLDNYEVPLLVWLENAAHRLRMTSRSEQRTFQEALLDVETKSSELIAHAQGKPQEPEQDEQLEHVIHSDDLLPYGWLSGALLVGRSIARIEAPRYQDGNLKFLRPGKPATSKGTGWLIGQQYMITNHHVINARSRFEPDAEDADLNSQAENATVEFDFDNSEDGGAATAAQVEALAAWVGRNASPKLDFAILKLKQPSDRQPLALAPNSINKAAGEVMPVNIIQHPNGLAKEVGIRNNLLDEKETDDLQLSYFTDTKQGSSGAPVCDDWWHVIGLHRATTDHHKIMFQGKETAYLNHAVRINRIIEHLKQHEAALWQAISPVVV